MIAEFVTVIFIYFWNFELVGNLVAQISGRNFSLIHFKCECIKHEHLTMAKLFFNFTVWMFGRHAPVAYDIMLHVKQLMRVLTAHLPANRCAVDVASGL